jgi:carboxyl-terminal processing protease
LDKSLSVKLKRVVKWKVALPQVLLLVLSGVLGFVVAMFFVNPTLMSWFDSDYWNAMSRFDESLRLAHARHVDEDKASFDALAEKAIGGMIESLDRHSSYYPPVQYQAFQDNTYRRYVGIGVMIRKVDKGVLLTKIFPSGPAEKAGLEVGEFILEVEGISLQGWELDKVSAKIKGERKTLVNLRVLSHDGEERNVRVRRDKIEISSIEQSSVDENGTGYLHLIQFTDRTGQEIRDALTNLQENGMKRLVLDLRDNSGGLLTAAVEVADLFLDKGLLVVSIKGREIEDQRKMSSTSSQAYACPLVILLNEGSASASEIVAGALAVHGRADLVGETSYGKGSVQTIFPLSDESGLRLTTAMYYLPDGTTIHEQGIEPDHFVPCSEDNETKLRVQRYGNRDLNQTEFSELFGFSPIPDLQKLKAMDLLLKEAEASEEK